MSEPSLPELEAERERLYAQLSEVGDFRRGSVSRELPQVREAELRVRAAGSSRSRPAVPVDPARCAGSGPGAGSWRPRRWGRSARELAAYAGVRVAGRADRGGQRGDLRGQAACRAADVALRRGRRKRGLCDALAQGEGRRDRAAGRRGRPGSGLRRRGHGGGGGGAPRRAAEARRRHARAAAGRRPGLPRAPRGLRERAPGRVRLLPGQGHRHGARPGHPHAGLVSLRGLRARPRPAGRRAGRGAARPCRRGWRR